MQTGVVVELREELGIGRSQGGFQGGLRSTLITVEKVLAVVLQRACSQAVGDPFRFDYRYGSHILYLEKKHVYKQNFQHHKKMQINLTQN